MDLLKVKVNCTELFRYSSQLRGHSNMRPPGPKSSPSSEVTGECAALACAALHTLAQQVHMIGSHVKITDRSHQTGLVRRFRMYSTDDTVQVNYLDHKCETCTT